MLFGYICIFWNFFEIFFDFFRFFDIFLEILWDFLGSLKEIDKKRGKVAVFFFKYERYFRSFWNGGYLEICGCISAYMRLFFFNFGTFFKFFQSFSDFLRFFQIFWIFLNFFENELICECVRVFERIWKLCEGGWEYVVAGY